MPIVMTVSDQAVQRAAGARRARRHNVIRVNALQNTRNTFNAVVVPGGGLVQWLSAISVTGSGAGFQETLGSGAFNQIGVVGSAQQHHCALALGDAGYATSVAVLYTQTRVTVTSPGRVTAQWAEPCDCPAGIDHAG